MLWVKEDLGRGSRANFGSHEPLLVAMLCIGMGVISLALEATVNVSAALSALDLSMCTEQQVT